MPYTIACFLWRKPGTSPSQFRTHYETIHMPLLVSVMGPVFPKTHTRFYLSKHAATEASGPDAAYVPTVFVGTNQDFDYDVYCELVFHDVEEFQAFFARIGEPEVARVVGEDEEKFLDRKMMRSVAVDEPVVTGRPE